MTITRGRKDVSEVERDLIDFKSDTPSPIRSQLDLYVSVANGDDDNDGLTPETAIATYREAVLRVQGRPVFAPLVIHLDSGVHVFEPLTLGVMSASVFVVGDGAGQTGDDGWEEIDTGTVNTVSGTSFNPNVAPVADAWQGMYVEFLDGPSAGNVRRVRNNDGTTVHIGGPFSDPTDGFGTSEPVNGNSFRILRPAAILEYPRLKADGTEMGVGQPFANASGGSYDRSTADPYIGLFQLGFRKDQTLAGPRNLAFGIGSWLMAAFDMRESNISINCEGARINAGDFFATAIPIDGSRRDSIGLALGDRYGNRKYESTGLGSILGSAQLQMINCSFTGGIYSYDSTAGFFWRGGAINIRDGAFVDPTSFGWSILDGAAVAIDGTGSGGLYVRGGLDQLITVSHGAIFHDVNFLVMEGTSASATSCLIRAYADGVVRIDGGSSDSGTSTNGVCFDASQGGRVYLEDGTFSWTGGAGEYNVGTPFSAKAISNIPNAGNYETEAGINTGGPSLVFRISSSLA